MGNPTKLASWKALESHKKEMENVQMRDLFAADPARFDKFHLQFQTILLDYSKNRITEKTMALLFELAREANVHGVAKQMFNGEKINTTEDRVLHIAIDTPQFSGGSATGQVLFESATPS